jgi:hypothetical protein
MSVQLDKASNNLLDAVAAISTAITQEPNVLKQTVLRGILQELMSLIIRFESIKN